MPITIRPATEADQLTIQAIIREAHINPNDLAWQRFLLAEDGGQIVGTGQTKPHPDGSRELASIAVIPAYQGKGIARQIIEALLALDKATHGDEPLYLMCLSNLEALYVRFGFRSIQRATMTPYFKRISRLAAIFNPIWGFFARQDGHLSIMEYRHRT